MAKAVSHAMPCHCLYVAVYRTQIPLGTRRLSRSTVRDTSRMMRAKCRALQGHHRVMWLSARIELPVWSVTGNMRLTHFPYVTKRPNGT
jgi:hypothetical protein